MRDHGPPSKDPPAQSLRRWDGCSGLSSSTILSSGACMSVASWTRGGSARTTCTSSSSRRHGRGDGVALHEGYEGLDRGAVFAPLFAALHSPRPSTPDRCGRRPSRFRSVQQDLIAIFNCGIHNFQHASACPDRCHRRQQHPSLFGESLDAKCCGWESDTTYAAQGVPGCTCRYVFELGFARCHRERRMQRVHVRPRQCQVDLPSSLMSQIVGGLVAAENVFCRASRRRSSSCPQTRSR